MARDWTGWPWRMFSAVGLLAGTLFFAASLTPSLIPRGFVVQGVLSGVAFSIGYGIGVLGLRLWHYLELPLPEEGRARLVKQAAALACAAVALVFLWRASGWQNSIRSLMGMEPVESVRPVQVGLIALAAFVVLFGLARLFRLVWRLVRIASAPSAAQDRRRARIAVATVLFIGVANGVLLRYACMWPTAYRA